VDSEADLITSEMVSNAVNASALVQAAGEVPVIRVCLITDGHVLTIECWDQASGLPVLRDASGLAESGRGLAHHRLPDERRMGLSARDWPAHQVCLGRDPAARRDRLLTPGFSRSLHRSPAGRRSRQLPPADQARMIKEVTWNVRS
jgi:hypothetical protein